MSKEMAGVNPKMLIWARERASYSFNMTVRFLEKSYVDPDLKLEGWENGTIAPTMPQLRKLSKFYKTSVALFFFAEPPYELEAPKDFRSISSMSPELSKQIRIVEAQQETLEDLIEKARFSIDPVSIEDDPVEVAYKLLDVLSVTGTLQRSWMNAPYRALNAWRDIYESAGCVVFQFSKVDVAECRGFSIFSKGVPAIAVNSKDIPSARIFTMAHEFCHIALRETGLCDLSRKSSNRVEVFCNAVAGSMVLRRGLLLSSLQVRRHKEGDAWTLDEIKQLASTFNASNTLVARRLLELGMMDKSEYGALHSLFHSKKSKTTKKKEGGDYYLNNISRHGMKYTGAVFDAYHDGRIGDLELLSMLGVKASNKDKLYQTFIDKSLAQGVG